MNLYGYGNRVEAREPPSTLNLPANPCGDCDARPVRCPKRWNVSGRLRNIARLRVAAPEFPGGPEERKERAMKSSRPRSAFCLLLLLLWLPGGVLFPEGSRGQGKPLVFPEVPGWRQDGKPQVFSPRTLYEYINGAADLYLTYDFLELGVADYKGEGKAAVTVEVYRHGSPTQAFGIYSQERLAGARFLEVGAQGYRDQDVLNFVTGPYYVKINGYNLGSEDERVLLAFARKMEEKLGGKSSLPPALALFPREGLKANTEKFISRNFLGYSYLHSGFTADYEVEGKRFKVFLIEGRDEGDCRKMMEKYLQQTGNGGRAVAEGSYRLKDRYHGQIDLFWKGSRIWGLTDLDDPEIRARFLKAFEASAKP